jgi:hypothetical protein
MWVFGLYAPLPKKMEWDDGRVERLMGSRRRCCSRRGRVGVGTGFFGMLTALPAMIGMRKNPDGARLADVVPADTYTRWSGLKAKYIGENDGIEQFRPLFAAHELMQAGLNKNGLTRSVEVRKQIESIAKKKDIKLTSDRHPDRDRRVRDAR